MHGRVAGLVKSLVSLVGIAGTLLLGVAAPSEAKPVGWEATVAGWFPPTRRYHAWPVAAYVRQLGSEHTAIMAAVCVTIPLFVVGRRRWALTALLGIVVGAAGAELAKHIVGRRTGSGHIVVYPSGHTAGATAVGVTLALIVGVGVRSPWARVAAWVAGVGFGIAVGWATIVTRAHFPADVLGGIAFGIFAPLLVWGISDVWQPNALGAAEDVGIAGPMETREVLDL